MQLISTIFRLAERSAFENDWLYELVVLLVERVFGLPVPATAK